MIFKSDLITLVLAFMSFIASAASLYGPPPPPVPSPLDAKVYVSTTSISCTGQLTDGLNIYSPDGECFELLPSPISANVSDFDMKLNTTCYFWYGLNCGPWPYERIVPSNTCGGIELGVNVSMKCTTLSTWRYRNRAPFLPMFPISTWTWILPAIFGMALTAARGLMSVSCHRWRNWARRGRIDEVYHRVDVTVSISISMLFRIIVTTMIFVEVCPERAQVCSTETLKLPAILCIHFILSPSVIFFITMASRSCFYFLLHY